VDEQDVAALLCRPVRAAMLEPAALAQGLAQSDDDDDDTAADQRVAQVGAAPSLHRTGLEWCIACNEAF
jgi:hypothetical protein